MLASRVAHASAKGRSQRSGALKPSSVYTNLATKFFGPVPPKAALLDPVATCSIGEKCAVMIWGTRCQSVARNLEVFGSDSHHLNLGIKGLHS
jgi:hypothetical protein